MNGLRADSLYVSIYRAKMKLTITYTGVVSQRIEIEIHTLDRKVEIHCYMNQINLIIIVNIRVSESHLVCVLWNQNLEGFQMFSNIQCSNLTP